MSNRFCYWTVVDGAYVDMAIATVQSARRVGVTEDFHVWADRPIPGAITHEAGNFDQWKWGCLFKLVYLRRFVQELDYDYFVWLDTDTYFVRHPGDMTRVLNGSPMHITLESRILSPVTRESQWWGCPYQKFAEIMWDCGVKHREIYNANGGFIVVRRDAVDEVCKLAWQFYAHCDELGYRFVDEPLFAYAMHMLCDDLEPHRIHRTADLWASDWDHVFANRLPDGKPWPFTDYFTDEIRTINPAIVHAMRSKDALIAEGQRVTKSKVEPTAFSPVDKAIFARKDEDDSRNPL